MLPARRSHDLADRPSSSDGGSRTTTNSRLGFLGVGDKPSSSSLLPPRSHSRGDSNTTRDPSSSNTTSSTIPSKLSQHTSPSKASSARTYDAKLVSREMHRLGNLAYMPTLAASVSNLSASSTLTLPPSVPNHLAFNSSTDNPWGSLHVHVLPLFNGEPLRIPVEDLNTLVKRHIQTIVHASPSKAIATLENDATDLISSGMVTLNAKLAVIDDDKLVSRLIDLWGFFWQQVLPYVEGVLLPLQTDPILSSISRIPKPHRPSDTSHGSRPSISSTLSSAPQIDVRTVAIHAFRDQIILPIFSRLHVCLTTPTNQDSFMEKATYQQPKLQQMLLVLLSQGRQRPVSLSLTAPVPQPSAGESAIQHLLRAIRSPLTQVSANTPSSASSKRTPSFLSGGQPRDRRGRIGQKPGHLKMSSLTQSSRRRGGSGSADFLLVVDDEYNDGGETPRVRTAGGGILGFDFVDAEREREREFLESLRSPDPESHRGSVGGWGLGNFKEEGEKKANGVEDEDEEMDWDQAQAVVEKMVGIKSEAGEVPRPEGRRKVV